MSMDHDVIISSPNLITTREARVFSCFFKVVLGTRNGQTIYAP